MKTEWVVCRTVACYHKELVIVGHVVNGDIGKGGDDLLLWRKIGALLELEIANCARQGKVAIDTSKVDKTTGGAYSCFFAWAKSVTGGL